MAGHVRRREPADGDGLNPELRQLLVDLAMGRLPAESARQLLDRMESDQALSAEFELILDLQNAGEGGDCPNARYRDLPPNGRLLRERSLRRWVLLRAAASLLIVVGGYLCLYELGKPPHYDLSSVTVQDVGMQARSGAESILDAAEAMLIAGKNRKAADLAEWYLASMPAGTARARAHVLLAGVSLLEARSTGGTILPRIDTVLVRSAFYQLEAARQEDHSGTLEEHILWLEGKAHLMLGEVSGAYRVYEQIVRMAGVRSSAARVIIVDLARSSRAR